MKKIVSIALLLCLLSSLLTGCSKESTKEETSSSAENITDSTQDTVAGTTSDTVPEEKKELSVWVSWSNEYLDSVTQVPAIQKMEELTNIHINYTEVTQAEATEKYGLMLASGDYPDILYQGSSAYPGGNEKAVDDGVFVDLTDYAEDHLPTYMSIVNTDEDLLRGVKTDSGKIIGIYTLATTNQGIEAEMAWCGMAVRGDWLDKLNMESPVTIEDWDVMLRAFKDELGCPSPLAMGPSGYVYNMAFLSAYGVTAGFYKDGDTIKYGPAQEGYKEYLELLSGWYADGLIDPNFASAGGITTLIADTEMVVNEKVGAFVTINSYVGNAIAQMGYEVPEGFYIEAVPAPVLNEGDSVEYSVRNEKILTNCCVVTTNCEDIPLACEWLDFQYTEEAMLLNNYGIEGETYVVNEGNDYQHTDYIKNNPDYSAKDMRNMNTFSAEPGNCPGLYNWEPWYQIFDEIQLTELEKWNVEGTDFIIPGTVSMTDAEGADYSQKYTAISTMVEEKTINVIIGNDTTDDWDQFVEDLYNYGLQDCLDYKQAAYDRYLNR